MALSEAGSIRRLKSSYILPDANDKWKSSSRYTYLLLLLSTEHDYDRIYMYDCATADLRMEYFRREYPVHGTRLRNCKKKNKSVKRTGSGWTASWSRRDEGCPRKRNEIWLEKQFFGIVLTQWSLAAFGPHAKSSVEAAASALGKCLTRWHDDARTWYNVGRRKWDG